MNSIEKNVYQLLTNKLNELGYSLVNVRYLRENKENYLRLTLDKDAPISLDEIVNISDLISPLLDTSDIIKDKYILDVSSLGIEKEIKLEKIDRYINQYLNIHLSDPYKGLNNIIGTLLLVNKDNVTMRIRDKSRTKDIVLLRKNIDRINLAIKF